MADKRRLPVLGGAPAPEEPVRSRWAWVGFGAAMVAAAWLVLGAAAWWMASTLALGPAVAALVMLPSVVLARFGGGFLVGRYGAPAGVREATLAGASVALLAFGLTWAGARSGPWLALLVAPSLLVGASAAGGAWGVKRRLP